MSGDIRWLGHCAKDRVLKHLVVPRTELPSEIPVRFAGVSREEVRVRARDGVLLATDVYLPRQPIGDGAAVSDDSFPAVVIRLPYGKREAFTYMPCYGRYFARRGYVCVIQDVRGRWGSEGTFDLFINEVDDGYDTLAWVAAQPWCSGSIGAFGDSYFGYTTWAMAAGGHPALRCISPGATTPNMHAAIFRNGAFCQNPFGIWPMWINGSRNHNCYNYKPYHLPLETLDVASRARSPQFRTVIAHYEYDEYWQARDLRNLLTTFSLPCLHRSGWYDNFLGETISVWRAMSARASHQYLEVSAVDHMLTPELTGHVGRIPVSRLGNSHDRVCLFFDRFLRDEDNDLPAASVNYYTVGADAWRTADDWPPSGTLMKDLFLRPGNQAAGRLVCQPPSEGAESTFVYDPQDPVPAWIGRDGWALAQGADRAQFADRPDVLVFDSAPLDADLEVSGPLRVTLYAATSAEDTDFIASLDDVSPDGCSQLVQQGVVRARSLSRGAVSSVKAGAVVEYAIDLWSTSHAFKAGHCLRVEISSSEFDRYDRNLNVNGPWGRESRPQTARQTIHFGGKCPSRIALPLRSSPRFHGSRPSIGQ